jgi:hypothetical protein
MPGSLTADLSRSANDAGVVAFMLSPSRSLARGPTACHKMDGAVSQSKVGCRSGRARADYTRASALVSTDSLPCAPPASAAAWSAPRRSGGRHRRVRRRSIKFTTPKDGNAAPGAAAHGKRSRFVRTLASASSSARRIRRQAGAETGVRELPYAAKNATFSVHRACDERQERVSKFRGSLFHDSVTFQAVEERHDVHEAG